MIYLILLGCILLALIVKFIVIDKVRIKWKTFLKKGFRPSRGEFGLYCYTGNQGKGKTYSLVEYVYDNRNHNEIYFTNIGDIQSLNYAPRTQSILQDYQFFIKNLDKYNAFYYHNFSELAILKEYFDKYNFKQYGRPLRIIYDELFIELQRGSTIPLPIQDLLCQLRKREIIFLTTCQIWSEVPLYFRRMCRYQINCNMIPILSFGVLLKQFNDAENMHWDADLQEHVAPTIELSITKTRKQVSDSYNTKTMITNYEDNA